jgi:uncharacterized membrane protein YhaH (DUF805 family)
MGFVDSISSGFSNYVTFSGRSVRSEYWYWTLFALLAGLASGLVDGAIFGGPGPINGLVSLALFLPGLAVSVRRLHDLDRSGWWLLLILTIVGGILLLVWYCMRGTVGPNRFGADPLAATTA